MKKKAKDFVFLSRPKNASNIKKIPFRPLYNIPDLLFMNYFFKNISIPRRTKPAPTLHTYLQKIRAAQPTNQSISKPFPQQSMKLFPFFNPILTITKRSPPSGRLLLCTGPFGPVRSSLSVECRVQYGRSPAPVELREVAYQVCVMQVVVGVGVQGDHR